MERRDKWQLAAAAVLAAFGTALAAVRPLGMRFSGFLLLALAGAVAVWVLLRRLSRAVREASARAVTLCHIRIPPDVT